VYELHDAFRKNNEGNRRKADLVKDFRGLEDGDNRDCSNYKRHLVVECSFLGKYY